MSASQYQRQLAINRIRQIELDTMNAIHRAKSIKSPRRVIEWYS